MSLFATVRVVTKAALVRRALARHGSWLRSRERAAAAKDAFVTACDDAVAAGASYRQIAMALGIEPASLHQARQEVYGRRAKALGAKATAGRG